MWSFRFVLGRLVDGDEDGIGIGIVVGTRVDALATDCGLQVTVFHGL